MDEQFRQYFDEMPCCASIHDRDYQIIAGNQRFREIYGERIGEPCYSVYVHGEAVCEDCPVERSFADGQSRVSEKTLRSRDGSEVYVLVHTTPLRDANGEIEAVVETHTDMAEVKHLERKLEKSRERLERLFDMVPCYITVQGRDLVIQNANAAFREKFGPAVGERCYKVYKHRDEQCLVCPAAATFEDGETREHEEVVTTVDGERLHVICTYAPIRNASGEVVAIIEMSTDITQIRQLQSQLTSIGLLVGSISHGIKGLLTGLDGGIYMVNSGFAKDDSKRVRKGWEMVERNVSRIRSMVLDILYYAKDRDLDVEDVEVAALAAEIRDVLRKRAGELDVALNVDVAPDAERFAADHKAIRATLINILENSLEACRGDRHKESHEVRFAVRREPPWMCFEVADNGIGMDQETREKIFSLFFSSKGVQGTGLGLFIAHKIVGKHGGTIDVESTPREGTRFLIRIPIEARPSTRPS